jgi:hypothetical protein
LGRFQPYRHHLDAADFVLGVENTSTVTTSFRPLGAEKERMWRRRFKRTAQLLVGRDLRVGLVEWEWIGNTGLLCVFKHEGEVMCAIDHVLSLGSAKLVTFFL